MVYGRGGKGLDLEHLLCSQQLLGAKSLIIGVEVKAMLAQTPYLKSKQYKYMLSRK